MVKSSLPLQCMLCSMCILLPGEWEEWDSVASGSSAKNWLSQSFCVFLIHCTIKYYIVINIYKIMQVLIIHILYIFHRLSVSIYNTMQFRFQASFVAGSGATLLFIILALSCFETSTDTTCTMLQWGGGRQWCTMKHTGCTSPAEWRGGCRQDRPYGVLLCHVGEPELHWVGVWNLERKGEPRVMNSWQEVTFGIQGENKDLIKERLQCMCQYTVSLISKVLGAWE